MKLSIITVTKNNKAGLLRAIECVRNQTYKNIEHIVVDGGSTDGTKELMDEGRGKMDDVKFLSEPDNGIYDAINKGIKLATGDVIGLLHSDDLYADERVLERYAEVFNSRAEGKGQGRRAQGDKKSTVILNDLSPGQARMKDLHAATDSSPAAQNDNRKLDSGSRQRRTGSSGMTGQVEAVYSDLVYVRRKADSGSRQRRADSSGMIEPTTSHYSILTTSYSVIRYWKAHKTVNSNQSSVSSKNTDHHTLITDNMLRNGWMPPHPTLFIRKEIFEKYGLYNTNLKISSDYEMILRLFYKHKITSYYLPVTTYLMSIGGASNKSLKNILQKSKEDYLAMKMNDINFPVLTLLSKNFRKLPQFLARDLS